MKIRLLYIEDDQAMRYAIKNELEDKITGYEVIEAVNGLEGLKLFAETKPDIVVTDLEMPVMDGMEVVKRIREVDARIPILITTSKQEAKFVSVGYEAGTSYYIKKPFVASELDAHIKGLLRIINALPPSEKTVYNLGEYTFDPKNYCLEYPAKKKHLTDKESQILHILCQSMGNVVPREEIMLKVWPSEVDPHYTSRSLDVFVNSLRKYLSAD
ncbi:MAG: response regulator transcription factor, partial [Tannerella sp.]|nr:response regulator transcription factor [Tannerella sp.]